MVSSKCQQCQHKPLSKERPTFTMSLMVAHLRFRQPVSPQSVGLLDERTTSGNSPSLLTYIAKYFIRRNATRHRTNQVKSGLRKNSCVHKRFVREFLYAYTCARIHVLYIKIKLIHPSTCSYKNIWNILNGSWVMSCESNPGSGGRRNVKVSFRAQVAAHLFISAHQIFLYGSKDNLFLSMLI